MGYVLMVRYQDIVLQWLPVYMMLGIICTSVELHDVLYLKLVSSLLFCSVMAFRILSFSSIALEIIQFS